MMAMGDRAGVMQVGGGVGGQYDDPLTHAQRHHLELAVATAASTSHAIAWNASVAVPRHSPGVAVLIQ